MSGHDTHELESLRTEVTELHARFDHKAKERAVLTELLFAVALDPRRGLGQLETRFDLTLEAIDGRIADPAARVRGLTRKDYVREMVEEFARDDRVSSSASAGAGTDNQPRNRKENFSVEPRG